MSTDQRTNQPTNQRTNQRTIQHTLERLVEQHHLAGATALVYRGGQVEAAGCAGLRDLRLGLPMTRDTLFRIASMTKPVTAMAALTLYEEGRFELDEPVDRWAPELAAPRVLRTPDSPLTDVDPARRSITFRDLLTHRSGVSYGAFWPGPIGEAYTRALGGELDSPLTPDQWLAALGRLPLLVQPGSGFCYGHSFDVLGVILARIEQASLEEVLRRRIFDPLGMADTGFSVPAEARSRRAASVGVDAQDRPVQREGGPGGSFVEERPAAWTYRSGGQGLWSTVDDYLTFARTFLGERAVLKPETLAEMTRDQLTDKQRIEATMFGMPLFGAGHGFGFGVAVVRDTARAAPSLCGGHAGSVGWPGAFGGWWQADPTEGSAVVLLTHLMVEASDLAEGRGLGAYVARDAVFRAVEASRPGRG